MSSTATAATARKITTRVRQAVGPAFRAETTSQGPYTFRVVVRRTNPDSLTADLGEAGRHASLIVREVMGLEVTSGIVRNARGVTLVLTVTDPDARKDTIAEAEAWRAAALKEARAELSDGYLAADTAAEVAATEPPTGRSERIAARRRAETTLTTAVIPATDDDGYPPYLTEEAREANLLGLNLVAPQGGGYLHEVYDADGRRLGTVRAVTEQIGNGFWFRFAAYDLNGARVGYKASRVAAAWLLAQPTAPEADSGHDTATAAPSNAELWR